MPETTPIEVTDGQRMLVCGCREVFTVSRLLFLKACTERTLIYCPLGHAFTPGDPENPSANALQSNLELTAALHDARRQSQALAVRRARMAADKSNLPPRRELKRRANLFALKSSPAEYGRRACVFCGNLKQNVGALASHLLRQHPAELAALEVGTFEPAGGGAA
jgi:hypothetical protein